MVQMAMAMAGRKLPPPVRCFGPIRPLPSPLPWWVRGCLVPCLHPSCPSSLLKSTEPLAFLSYFRSRSQSQSSTHFTQKRREGRKKRRKEQKRREQSRTKQREGRREQKRRVENRTGGIKEEKRGELGEEKRGEIRREERGSGLLQDLRL
jgi:hypothetical protein